MIISLHVTFRGNCAEAIAFYESVFLIEEKSVITFKDSPIAPMFTFTPEAEGYIYQARLRFACGTSLTMGDSLTLLMSPDSAVWTQEIIDVFDLSIDEINAITARFMDIGAKANYPLGPKDGYELYSSFIDPFGVCWNLFCGEK